MIRIAVFICVFIALWVGLLSAFGVNPFKSNIRVRVDDIMLAENRKRIVSPGPGRLERFAAQFLSVLEQSHMTLQKFLALEVVAFFGGLLMGFFLFNTLLLAIVTGFCLLPLPIIYGLYEAQVFRQKELDQLESMMSQITQSYIASNNIVAAIDGYNYQRNMGLDPRLRHYGPLDKFVTDIHTVDPSIIKGLWELQAKFNNRYFDEWASMLMMCQKNRDLKFALQPIIKAMNDAKIMRLEADTQFRRIWIDFFTLMCIMFSIIPVVRVSNVVWFNILVYTPVGQAIVIAMLLTAMCTTVFMLHVTRPID